MEIATSGQTMPASRLPPVQPPLPPRRGSASLSLPGGYAADCKVEFALTQQGQTPSGSIEATAICAICMGVSAPARHSRSKSSPRAARWSPGVDGGVDINVGQGLDQRDQRLFVEPGAGIAHGSMDDETAAAKDLLADSQTDLWLPLEQDEREIAVIEGSSLSSVAAGPGAPDSDQHLGVGEAGHHA